MNLTPRAAAPARPPAMGVSRNPLVGLRPQDMQRMPVGVTIRSLQPESAGPLICVLNGSPLPRLTERQRAHHARLFRAGKVEQAQRYLQRAAGEALNWQHVRTRAGDVIEWHEQPQDKESFRTVLMIATVVAALIPGLQAFAPYLAAASLAYNLLVPPTVAQQRQEEAGKATFNTSLGGNQARLDQPIWRNFGRVKITPPFAAAPYYEYVDGDGDNLDNDQYYHAVFAIGIDDHELETALIGRTPISHFQDVLRADYLAPGVQPSVALCNVVTSNEVGQLELETGKYVGGYAACQPKRRAASIGIDVMCPQGLGKSGALTVSWRVDVREINDYGAGITPWRILGSETRTADTNTPQRWSVKYALTTAARVEIRVARSDAKDLDSTARHSLQWIGLRAYLDEAAPLNADTAHYEVVMRASEQLSANSQRDFSLIVWPLVRTWSPGGGWGAKVRTRNAAWALADLWSNPVWGEGLPDSRINLQGLYDWSLTLDTRQDRFDYSFAASTSAWDAAQLTARAGRARCFRRYGVNTLARDEWFELPMTALTPRNTLADTMVLNEPLPNSSSADGIIATYRSNITWDQIEIECPCPGYSVTDPGDPRYDAGLPPMANPVYKNYDGITGATHAEREGLYDAANMMLRRRTVSCTTEMQGVITSYMMPVLWQPDVAGHGQSGDVAFWNATTLVMGLTEMPVFGTSGQTYLTLTRDDGTLTDPVLVSPGPTEWDVTLPAAPDFALVLDDGMRERPKFVLGDMDLLVKVSAIGDGGRSQGEDGGLGAQLYDIAGVVDDVRVHTADAHLLPGPGDIQDPVDSTGEVDGGGGTLLLVTLAEHYVETGSGLTGGGTFIQITLRNNGTMSIESDDGLVEFPNEWLLTPAEVSGAAQFDVYASSPVGGILGDLMDTWLTLGTERSWTVDSSHDRVNVPLRIRIRETATGVVQGDRTMNFLVLNSNLT